MCHLKSYIIVGTLAAEQKNNNHNTAGVFIGTINYRPYIKGIVSSVNNALPLVCFVRCVDNTMSAAQEIMD